MLEQVAAISNANIRILIYNGDVDSVCNVMMNMRFLKLMNRTVSAPDDGGDVDSNQPWYYQHESPRVVGFVTRYAGGMLSIMYRL